MAWTDIGNVSYRQPQRLHYPKDSKVEITTFLVCNICYGITWSPNGKNHPSLGPNTGWVWGGGNGDSLQNYINQLWEINLIPIFYSDKRFNNDREVCEEIIATLSIDPIVFLRLQYQRY